MKKQLPEFDREFEKARTLCPASTGLVPGFSFWIYFWLNQNAVDQITVDTVFNNRAIAAICMNVRPFNVAVGETASVFTIKGVIYMKKLLLVRPWWQSHRLWICYAAGHGDAIKAARQR